MVIKMDNSNKITPEAAEISKKIESICLYLGDNRKYHDGKVILGYSNSIERLSKCEIYYYGDLNSGKIGGTTSVFFLIDEYLSRFNKGKWMEYIEELYQKSLKEKNKTEKEHFQDCSEELNKIFED